MAQLLTVAVGPLATADDDGVSLSQKCATSARNLVINGALAGSGASATFVANSICASQTPGGAGALTINGTLATTNPVAGAGGTAAAGSATVRFPTPQRIYVTTAGNDTARSIVVVGTLQGPGTFGPGAVITETIVLADTSTSASTNLYSTIISLTIDAASAGAMTVGHSGTATMDKARRVSIVSAGNDAGITFALVGTDINGDPISETITGTNGGTATSVLSYLTVTSVRPSAAVATTVTVGSSAVADSQWLYFDRLAGNAQVGIQVEGSGTVNWTVSQTLNDITIPQSGSNLPTVVNVWTADTVKWVNHPDSALVASAVITGVQGSYDPAPVMARLTLNSGTGSIRGTFVQDFLY